MSRSQLFQLEGSVMRNSVLVVVCMLSFILAVGCSPATRKQVKTVKVSGTVTLNGKPLADAEVNFSGKEFAGIAKTDASGNYTIDAQPGDNTIFFSKYDKPVDPTMSPGDAGGISGGPKQLIPKKFASINESKLTHSVPDAGATGVNFDLK